MLEGGDGAGKSRQARLLRDWLIDMGETVHHLREPGSTATGEAIRKLLLAPGTGGITPWTEALLFSAARGELLSRQIRPALSNGEMVLVERCWLSTMAYQCMAPTDSAERVPLDDFERITRLVHGETWPDRMFLLDVTPETRRARSGGRPDRIEAKGADYHDAVREAYLQLAADDPRVVLVDANGSVEDVQQVLRQHIQALLEQVRS